MVIVTALEEEREAILQKLDGWEKLDQDGQDVLVYYDATIGTRRKDGASYGVIVTSLGHMGPIAAAAKASTMVLRWKPQCVLLVGIAGGVSGKVDLGDVMVASQIADYTVGKQHPTGERTPRWEVHRADEMLFNAADNFATGWEDLIGEARPADGRPRRRTGVIASGGDVIASPEVMASYQDVWGKLVGVEMEGGGLASGLHITTPRVRFLMIRGVSDLADATNNTATKAAWRTYAAHVAAAYTVGFLRMGPFPSSP